MFSRVQGYSFENIDKFSPASLVTRMTTDVFFVQMSFMQIIRIAIRCPLMFIFSDTVASLFVKAEDVTLLEISAHAIKIFCFAYLFRWIGVTTQSYFSAIGKPLQATVVSVGTAFVFPVVLLGALWCLGLDGIWFNFVGVNILTAILSAVLLVGLKKEIKKKEMTEPITK